MSSDIKYCMLQKFISYFCLHQPRIHSVCCNSGISKCSKLLDFGVFTQLPVGWITVYFTTLQTDHCWNRHLKLIHTSLQVESASLFAQVTTSPCWLTGRWINCETNVADFLQSSALVHNFWMDRTHWPCTWGLMRVLFSVSHVYDLAASGLFHQHMVSSP